MAQYRAAVLGCGGRGRAHADGYARADNAEIVACADPVEENAQRFAGWYGVEKVYADYRQLLDEVKPDVVSVCTWPHLHREMVEASVAAGVKGIHAEKPMAPTWGDAKAMHAACETAGVMMTFCHQRRFNTEFRKARELLRNGAIGEIVRLEGYCPNLFDWGTHWFDMFGFFNRERQAKWVLGQIDVSLERKVFGVPVETAGLSHVYWDNGVTGLMVTNHNPDTPRVNRLVGNVGMVLHGTEGRIDVHVSDGPTLRVRRFGQPSLMSDEWPEVRQEQDATVLSVLDLLKCLDSGREPELSSRRALRATELIFATYESSRRRARIDLPLETEDSALITGLEDGTQTPRPREI